MSTEEIPPAETIVDESIPVSSDPVAEFRKGKTKRERKRKEVKIIETVVPPTEPSPVEDVDAIANKVAQMVYQKMAAEGEKETTKKVKKPRKSPPTPTSAPVPEPPPTKTFGWC
jgi:hypothetical protein